MARGDWRLSRSEGFAMWNWQLDVQVAERPGLSMPYRYSYKTGVLKFPTSRD
jgi:hypothetical protein